MLSPRNSNLGATELNIFGTPTYGMGDLDYRWAKFLQKTASKLSRGRLFGLFALDDHEFHGGTFAGNPTRIRWNS